LLELIPGGAKQFLSVTQARTLLATLDKKIKAADKQLTDLLTETPARSASTASAHPTRPDCSATPVTSAGSPPPATSPPGTAPHPSTPPAATTNATDSPAPETNESTKSLHIMAIVQLRNDTAGRTSYRRKLAAGRTPMEALRCLKRRLSDVVYKQLVRDAKQTAAASRGGHMGATLTSSAADPTPTIDSSNKSLPERATNHNTPTSTVFLT
jgi:transposase